MYLLFELRCAQCSLSYYYNFCCVVVFAYNRRVSPIVGINKLWTDHIVELFIYITTLCLCNNIHLVICKYWRIPEMNYFEVIFMHFAIITDYMIINSI